ncbi:MAG TPA: hypothetical protein VLJ80_02815 [Solirubrobacteraceae bacterium]|nr:hypothetical protein [Solirubrobacteraceae bacterium]
MSIRKALTAFLAAAMVVALAASTAAALTPTWQGCMALKGGRYENNLCTTKAGTKKFDWLEANSKPRTASSEGTLKLADTKTGLAVQCTTVKTGTVGSSENASLGEVKEVKATGCKTTKGTCAEPSVEAVNLPWKTELALVGEEIRDKLKSAVKAPGWKILCAKVVNDTCEGATSVKLTNKEKEGIVEVEYEAKSEQPSCSSGGKGEVFGASKLEATEAGVTSLRAGKGSRFKVTASPREVKKGGISIVTIKAIEAAKTETFVHDEAPEGSFKYTEEAVNFCKGTYKALEECSFGVTYIGEEESLFLLLVVDENEGAAATSVFGK